MLSPHEFTLKIQEAMEDEDTARKIADMHIKLFTSTQPISRQSKSAVSIKKKETKLKGEIKELRADLDALVFKSIEVLYHCIYLFKHTKLSLCFLDSAAKKRNPQ